MVQREKERKTDHTKENGREKVRKELIVQKKSIKREGLMGKENDIGDMVWQTRKVKKERGIGEGKVRVKQGKER
jgi:hypothetical protein